MIQLTALEFRLLVFFYRTRRYAYAAIFPAYERILEAQNYGGFANAEPIIRQLVDKQVFSVSPDDQYFRLTEEGRVAYEHFHGIQSEWESDAIGRASRRENDDIIIRAGNKYAAQRAIRDICAKAKNELRIMDPYFGADLIDRITDSGTQAAVRVVTEKMGGVSLSYLAAAKSALKGLEIRQSTSKQMHDRFVVCDGMIGYQIGHSLKDAGNKDTRISRVSDVAALTKLFEERWAAATTVSLS